MLIIANQPFVYACENSKEYLNCPTHMLNYLLDTLFRLGGNKDEAINEMALLLKKYKYEKPKVLATNFYEWRNTITLKEFDEININKYMDDLPIHIQVMNDNINNWVNAHTTNNRYGYVLLPNIPSYPHKCSIP